MGKTKESENAREQFAEHIKEEKAFYLNPNFLAIDTKYKLLDANREAAKIWLEQLFVTNDERLHFYKLYQYFTADYDGPLDGWYLIQVLLCAYEVSKKREGITANIKQKPV